MGMLMGWWECWWGGGDVDGMVGMLMGRWGC